MTRAVDEGAQRLACFGVRPDFNPYVGVRSTMDIPTHKNETVIIGLRTDCVTLSCCILWSYVAVPSLVYCGSLRHPTVHFCCVLWCLKVHCDILRHLASLMVCCDRLTVESYIRMLAGNFGWVRFLVVCFLYKINPNPRKCIYCGKKWPKCHL